MSNLQDNFRKYRERMNARIMNSDSLVIKRLMNLDTRNYEDAALSAREKEMLGLVASLVLRCDDCVKYHLEQSKKCGITTAQIDEIFATASLVGGSIVIPHVRRAYEYWDQINKHHSDS